MKRRYQIDQQRAVQEFWQLAREENPDLQMIERRSAAGTNRAASLTPTANDRCATLLGHVAEDTRLVAVRGATAIRRLAGGARMS